MASALPDPNPDTVIVGMSGGVDSAVAALLLREPGHAVQGLFMSNWEDDEDAYCTTAADFQDARRVCETLDIPLHRVSFAAEYRERVFRIFCASTRPAARRIPTCCATGRSSSASAWITCTASVQRESPPGTTRGCAARRAARSC